MKMRLKGCRRCGGDLVHDRSDREGLTMNCLQCGQEIRLRPVSNVFNITPLRQAPVAQPSRAA
jgi:hypothetical protein